MCYRTMVRLLHNLEDCYSSMGASDTIKVGADCREFCRYILGGHLLYTKPYPQQSMVLFR
jgi:hypothetical protein